MAQQLPRSWMMRVWSNVGGGSMLSMRGFSSVTMGRPVGAATLIHRGCVSLPRSQSSLILSRPSSAAAAHRVLRSAGSSGEVFRAGIGRNFVEGYVVSGRGLKTSRLPLLPPFLTRGLSSAEAQTLADGFVKESLVKEGEEKSVAPLTASADGEAEKAVLTEVIVEEEARAPEDVFPAAVVEEEGGVAEKVMSAVVAEKETDEVRERDTLVAEIESKELELAELRNALKLVDEKQGVVVESAIPPGFPEVDVSAEQAAASQVSAALEEFDHDNVAPVENEEDNSVVPSLIGGEDGVGTEENAGSESIAHPWPEWMQFLKELDKGGHFVTGEETEVDMNGATHDDVGLIKRACLNFARERDDIFLHYSRKNLEVVARFGCPCTDRKVVNAGKRLRDFLAIDEISVCKPCALRSSCERRDFKASADHVSGTPEVIRLLSQYALEVSPYAKDALQIPSAVQIACRNLLNETVSLGTVPRDPSLPKIQRTGDASIKSERRERESKRKIRDTDVEMKPGDWKCEECQYVNFARNRSCRECDAFRPVPEMRPGDWRCPECNFLNFSKNQECYDCKIDRPASAGARGSYDTGSRYDRGAPQDRGSRFDRDRRSEVRSYDRGSERGSFARSETRDYERGSDRYASPRGDRESFGRSRERGGLERRSGSDEARSGGRRSKFEEWKPDLKKRGDFDEDERKDRRSALDIIDDDDDDDDDDLEFDSDEDEDISDVEPLKDEEFEDMRPAASASRGDRGGDRDAWSRGGGRNEDKDQWWENDRGFRSERSDRGSRGGGSGGRGRGRGGGRGGRGDFGRDRSTSRDSRPSSYERSDRDSGRSYGRSDRDSDRPRGRGGARGGRGGGRRGGGGRGRGRR